MTDNNSKVNQVEANFTVSRSDAGGHMADALRFTIRGGRCETLSELGTYMHKLIDDYIAALSPGGLELQALRKRVAELEASKQKTETAKQTNKEDREYGTIQAPAPADPSSVVDNEFFRRTAIARQSESIPRAKPGRRK